MAAAHDALKWSVYMHTRRLITFLLGAWFALVVTIACVAALGFQVANNIAKTPPTEAGPALVVLGEPMVHQLFRYVAAEINRTLFEVSGLGELGILLALTSLLLLSNYNRRATILAGVLLLAAFASHFLLTPQVVSQGRILDFRPAEMLMADRARFARLHMLFGVVTVFRLLGGVWLAGVLLYRGPNSRMRRRRGDVDGVDHPEDGHVNR